MQSKTTLMTWVCLALFLTISSSQGIDGEQSSRERSFMKTELEGGASAQQSSGDTIIGSAAKTLSSAGHLPGSPSVQKEEGTATDAPSTSDAPSTLNEVRATAAHKQADAPSVIYAENKQELSAKEEKKEESKEEPNEKRKEEEPKEESKEESKEEEPKKEEPKKESKEEELKEEEPKKESKEEELKEEEPKKESKEEEPKEEPKKEDPKKEEPKKEEPKKEEPKEEDPKKEESQKEEPKDELTEKAKAENQKESKQESKEESKEELKEETKGKDEKEKEENKDQIQSIAPQRSQKPALSTVAAPTAVVNNLAGSTSATLQPNAPTSNKTSQVGQESGAQVIEKNHSAEKPASSIAAQTTVAPATKQGTPTPTTTKAKSSQDVPSAKDQPLVSSVETSSSLKSSTQSTSKLPQRTSSSSSLAGLSSKQSTPSKLGQSTPTASKLGQATPTGLPSSTASSQTAPGQSPSEKSNSAVAFETAHSSTEVAESLAPVNSNAAPTLAVPAAPVDEPAKVSNQPAAPAATPITTNSTQTPAYLAVTPKDSVEVVPIQAIAAYLNDYKAAENILNISLKVYAEMQLNKKLPLDEDELENYDILKNSLAVAKSLIRKTANKIVVDSSLSEAEKVICRQQETTISKDIGELTSKINKQLVPSAVSPPTQPPKPSSEPTAAIAEINPLLSAAIPPANSQTLSTTPSTTEVSGAIAVHSTKVGKQTDDILEAPSAKDGAKTLSVKSLRTA